MAAQVLLAFEKVSYRSQVLRLRRLAYLSLQSFDISVRSVEFINHGENATFKVSTIDGQKFLLRIHRANYHSEKALLEEIAWLEILAKRGVSVPRPFRSRHGTVLIEVKESSVGARYCDLFHWIDGSFLSKSISKANMHEIGSLLAEIQGAGRSLKGTNRRYWMSDGLVGAAPRFGSIDAVPGIGKSEQLTVTLTRKKVLLKLRAYEKKFPKKMGMIHADLHFGNLLRTKSGKIAAIDFDDSGYGFYVYDLVIPLIGLEHHLKLHKRMREYNGLKQALLEGYSSVVELTAQDRKILQDLIVARKLLMISWLNSRSDHPQLKKRVKKYAKQTLKYIADPYL